MRFSTSAVISALVALAVAQDLPKADTSKAPSGNPISKPGLNEQVPKGQTYTITWNNTTPGMMNATLGHWRNSLTNPAIGTVSLVLLRGDSQHANPTSLIVAKTPNTGTYPWAVPDSLEVDDSRYGIQLIDDADPSIYQYTTQFGISGNSGSGSGSGSASGASPLNSASNSTSTATVIYASSSATGTGNVSIPVLTPTAPMTVPSTLSSTVTSEPSSVASGTISSAPSSIATGAAAPMAAVRNVGALVVAALVGALAL